MSENKINRIKEYCKENIKENKKDKLQFYSNKNLRKITLSEIFYIYFIMASFAVNPSSEFSFT